MHPITALDIAGVPHQRINQRTVSHACPACGDKAWSGRWHTQCWNPQCPAQAMAPEDLIMLFCEDHAEAAVLRATGKSASAAFAARRERRAVLDFWVRESMRPVNSQVADILSRRAKGAAVDRLSVSAFDRSQMVELIRLAERTGASYPDTWTEDTPPGPCLVYVVQTVPHIVDRIVLFYPHGSKHIVWRDRCAGISGLLGLRPHVGKFLTADFMTAIEACSNDQVRASGVAFVHNSKLSGEFQGLWEPDRPFVACAGTPDQVISLHSLFARMPALERSKAVTEFSRTPVSWSSVRRGVLTAAILADGGDTVPPEAASLFERTGGQRGDAAFAVSVLLRRGMVRLAADVRNLMTRRAIFSDDKMRVAEDMNRIIATSRHGEYEVANFCVDALESVTFAERADLCVKANVRCGPVETEILISDRATLNVKRLQEEVATQFLRTHKKESAALPTIVDMKIMQQFVMPALRRSLTGLRVIPGITNLGWTIAKDAFVAPGVTFGPSGPEENSCVFHPSQQLLGVFGKVPEWSAVFPDVKPGTAMDLVMAILAQIVRHFKHGMMVPVTVTRDTKTVTAINTLASFTGQRIIHTLNPNHRDRGNIDGVRGYPLFVDGGYQAQYAPCGYVLLTDRGMTVDEDRDAVEAAGRFLQRALADTVAWCVRAEADGFSEVAGVCNNIALAAEGSAVLEMACGIRIKPTCSSPAPTLERFLSEMTFTEAEQRLSLSQDMRLTIRVGDALLAGNVAHELTALGDADVDVADQTIRCSATVVLPTIARFYGKRPEPHMV